MYVCAHACVYVCVYSPFPVISSAVWFAQEIAEQCPSRVAGWIHNVISPENQLLRGDESNCFPSRLEHFSYTARIGSESVIRQYRSASKQEIHDLVHAVSRCSCATLASTGRTHRAIHERTTPPLDHGGRSNSEKRREAAFPPIVPVDYRVSQSGSHDAFSGLLLVPCPLQQRDPNFLCPCQHLVGPRPHTAQSQRHQVI